MRVLGVDPGLTRCGLGVVDGGPAAARDGRRRRRAHPGDRRTGGAAASSSQTEIDLWLARFAPDAVAVERVFANVNVAAVMTTAQATAVALLAAARRGLPVVMHTPTEVKAAVTGYGRADKAQVTAMVTRILGLEVAPKPADAADALALAICHVWRGGAQRPAGDARPRPSAPRAPKAARR